jgi:hypothetical protein
MRTRWFGYTSAALAIAAGLSVTDTAFTQGAQPVGSEIGTTKQAVLTSDQQLARAAEIEKQGGTLAERLMKMLDEARREKDILRANCINRKVTEVNATVGSVGQRARALKEAIAGNDEGRRNHEYTVLTVLAQPLNGLDRQAGQCLGQDIYEPGASQVVTTVPNDSPTLDPTDIGSAPPPSSTFTVPPSSVSPTF